MVPTQEVSKEEPIYSFEPVSKASASAGCNIFGVTEEELKRLLFGYCSCHNARLFDLEFCVPFLSLEFLKRMKWPA
jgi:hypothetical protein